MSDIENKEIIEEEYKTIAQVKKEKKEKKLLNPEVSKIRSENMKKAIAQKKKNFEDKNKLKLIEYNISELINNNEESDDEKIEDKPKNKNNKKEEQNIKVEDKNNDNYKNMLDTINNTILNINKKVEKLYIMKKNKPIKQQPIYKENNQNNDLLTAIKNKMLNN